jgi:putative NADH-flavin reductase
LLAVKLPVKLRSPDEAGSRAILVKNDGLACAEPGLRIRGVDIIRSNMNILVLGATGAVGRRLVAEGLKRGHCITAFVRNAGKVEQQAPALRVVVGNVLDTASLAQALEGQDAVAYSIGVRSPRPTTLFSDSTRSLVALMERPGVKRLICITGVGAGETKGHGGFLYDRIGYPLITRNIYLDKDRQEEIIRRSALEWTIVRPTVFREGQAKSEFQAVTDVNDVVLRRISRQEVANFVLDELETGRFIHQTPFIGHAN